MLRTTPLLQLVRDFIHDSLYHPTEGYFTKQTASGGCWFVGCEGHGDLVCGRCRAGAAGGGTLRHSCILARPSLAVTSMPCPAWRAMHAGAAVVGALRQPLDFRSFGGQTDYLLAVQVGA